MLNESQSNLKMNILKECPEHSSNRGCMLCDAREKDRYCECLMCQTYAKQLEGEKQLRASRISLKIEQKLKRHKMQTWQLQYILKRLLPPQNKIIKHTFGVFIAEICFYKQGEAHSLYLNAENTERGPGIREPPVIRIKKEKLTNTQIQKILNEKRRKYREKVGTLRKYQRKIIEYGKKQAPPETKDAVVISTSTKDQSCEELHEENYFIGLMLRRKQDPVFKNIDFIKNFIGVAQEDKRVIFCRHQQGQCKFPELFKRSVTLMRVYASNIIPGEQSYISLDQQALYLQYLAKTNPNGYAYYTLYKIINYIEYFHDQKITYISMKFLLNEINELYLLHVYKVKKHDLVKYAWTEQTYLKKIAEGEQKLVNRMPRIELEQKSKNRSCLIQSQMKSHYEYMKVAMGFGEVQKNDQEEKYNNQFFSKIHPEISTPISEILKDKAMTVQKFRQKYLGYKNHKKPVASEFNSNLVKTLHKLTPRLKVAQGHEIDDKQLEKPASRSVWSVGGKRSMSNGNTLSTMNKTVTFFL